MSETSTFQSESGINDATKRQRWALYCITKKDFRSTIISKEEASKLIKTHNTEKLSAFTTFEKIYEEADTTAKKAVEALTQVGGIGFAWVIIKPKDCEFAKWLKTKDIGGVNDYQKAYCIFLSGEYGQDLLKKEEYVHTFAQVLRKYNINATADSRID